jgi:hypothetical protein
MKKILFLVFVFVGLSCSDKEPFEEDPIISVAGHTYAAKWKTIDFRTLYIIYEMSIDSTISITERLDTETGEIYDQSFGFYKYSHPELDLKVRSICDECFNYFTATVAEDRKSFTYEIWDLPTSKFWDLVFKIKK